MSWLQEIVEDLEAALEQFREIAGDLSGNLPIEKESRMSHRFCPGRVDYEGTLAHYWQVGWVVT
jgi:hypothetical protein